MKILSFDIGGSKISYTLVDEEGNKLMPVVVLPTPENAIKINSFLRETVASYEYDAMAVATAGVVHNGKLMGKPINLPAGYERINFAEISGKPTLLENDANSAIWAEYRLGSLKDTKDSLLLTLGTGVGCGIISNGHLLRGKTGAAGEVDFPLSGRDLANLASENGLTEKDCFTLVNMAAKGNVGARQALITWRHNLINTLIMLCKLFDMEAVSLSGSLSGLVNYASLKNAVNQHLPYNPVQIKSSQFGNDAGIIGAALLLKEKYHG